MNPTATELCDSVDNDCDGVVDGLTRPCGSGTGACTTGAQTCTSGSWGMCVGGTGSSAEICDGADNDCDGTTDEGNPGGGASCGIATGACTPGTTRCMGGSLVCTGGTSGSMETCNGVDDDCDGLTDEGNPGGGGVCGSSDTGLCERGMEVCAGGALVCRGSTGPTAELCDNLDNDCDGTIDEGNPEAKGTLRTAYAAANLPAEIEVYEGTLHGWCPPDSQVYNEAQAERAIELLLALAPWGLDEIRDRGRLRERLGDYAAALPDLEAYLRHRPDARDAQTISESIRSLRHHINAETP